AYVTRAMTERFDEIARAIPEFYFGRFDVRFPTIEDLQRGEHFTILEINGASAGPGDIYDRNTRLFDAYRTLIRQFSLLFEIARRNRARGFTPVGLLDLLRLFRREQRLTQLYPLTQ
ncbi:MAG: D-alanine--D-alanine ligase, partial [Alphaproteobacteria bacterium]